MQYIFVSCTVCVLISANAAIAKYLDYKHFIVLQSCYGGVTGCDVTQKSATTKIKTGLDLFFFWRGCRMLPHFFFLCENAPEWSHSHRLPHLARFFFFGWCHVWKLLRQTHSYSHFLSLILPLLPVSHSWPLVYLSKFLIHPVWSVKVIKKFCTVEDLNQGPV